MNLATSIIEIPEPAQQTTLEGMFPEKEIANIVKFNKAIKFNLEEVKEAKTIILDVEELSPEEAIIYDNEYDNIINQLGADEIVLNEPTPPTMINKIKQKIINLGFDIEKINKYIKPGMPLHKIIKYLLIFLTSLGLGIVVSGVIIIGIISEIIFAKYDKNKPQV